MELFAPLPPDLLAAIVAEAEAEQKLLAAELDYENEVHDMLLLTPYFEFGGPGRNQGGCGIPRVSSLLGMVADGSVRMM